MLSDEEKQTIEYLKARLYGNEGCKIIDVAQSDLRIFLKLVENLQKDIENWKKYCDEQENDITLKNNKICDLEFKIEKQSKEIEELKAISEYREKIIKGLGLKTLPKTITGFRELIENNNKKWEDKIKAKIEEYQKQIEKMEKDDIGVGFTLGKEWSDLKAKVEFGQSLLEKE